MFLITVISLEREFVKLFEGLKYFEVCFSLAVVLIVSNFVYCILLIWKGRLNLWEYSDLYVNSISYFGIS